METQRDNLPWGRWSLLLLLLGLAVPPATAQDLSYNQAVLAAVDGYNQRSSEANLYRLLELDPQRPDADLWDDNPSTPKPVSFTLKETVCPRTTQLPPEQCEFKENGLVKQCVGTVTLGQAGGYFDINCAEGFNHMFRRSLPEGDWIHRLLGRPRNIGCTGERLRPEVLVLGAGIGMWLVKGGDKTQVWLQASAQHDEFASH
ncbi:cathelicidin-5-like [Phyllostomus hastatus]|uniref:cathelicidin-5-like n=1 Tax=Phyllostomus hastatus TaxID=9423 RepID=UPI001E685B49|nr:cathelicidin-5-like [Phyllostomus hastatus]